MFSVFNNALGMCHLKKVMNMLTSGCSNTICNHTVTELGADGYITLKVYSPLEGKM
jgi:hypothetical protein